MLETRIHNETAIAWAKTKSADELRAMIEDWGKVTPRESAKIVAGFAGIIVGFIACWLCFPRADQHVAYVVGKWAGFAGSTVILLAMMIWFQRESNAIATARHALRLQEAGITPPSTSA